MHDVSVRRAVCEDNDTLVTLRERTHRFYERLGYVTRKSQKAFEKNLG